MSIQLKISLPESSLPTVDADKVVLPVLEGTLTVIKDRAPELRLLTAGKIVLLDENNHAFRQWTISGGVADIAEDVCSVATTTAQELS
jgi:F0F1-type ATP synthase epsilon subunit